MKILNIDQIKTTHNKTYIQQGPTTVLRQYIQSQSTYQVTSEVIEKNKINTKICSAIYRRVYL